MSERIPDFIAISLQASKTLKPSHRASSYLMSRNQTNAYASREPHSNSLTIEVEAKVDEMQVNRVEFLTRGKVQYPREIVLPARSRRRVPKKEIGWEERGGLIEAWKQSRDEPGILDIDVYRG